MKQNLQFRITQQLTMTPQLQQAVRLLQLSTLELKKEIQLALENNPLLEQHDFYEEIDNYVYQDMEVQDTCDAFKKNEIPKELPLDTSWDVIYTTVPSLSIGSKTDYQADDVLGYQYAITQTLKNYLMWQVDITTFSEIERAIAVSIIDAVEDNGYLTVSLEEIHSNLGNNKVSIEDIEVVLRRIQRFDPVGACARDLRECLLVQLSQFPSDLPLLREALLVVRNHIKLLANHNLRTLMQVTCLTEDVLKKVIQLIKTLDPRPGYSINTREPEYIVPDVIVRKVSNSWLVELNADCVPHLKINQYYATTLNTGSCSLSDAKFIRNNLQEAQWLIKSLESRNDTLLKVTRCIVDQQQAFFLKGEEFMRPMVLADIANVVKMHESTISRVTTQKYLHSPRGIFELKYFFSSHVNTASGGEASSTAIRALVKKLILSENPTKPFSDKKISLLLLKQGIIVARRTVTKYRESLFIPPSKQRKQLI